jgi:hypothetical protein
MKKDSGVFRISENQEIAVQGLCAKHSITRSELFRRIIFWAIAVKLPIPKQNGGFRFTTANSKGDSQKSSYLFGSKLSSDILLKINYLCKCHGVKESHLYRSFLEGYLLAHTGGVRPSRVNDQPKLKHAKGQNLNLPSLLFSKPTFTYKLPKPDTNTLIGRIQAYNMAGIEQSKQISNLLALGLVLIFCFSKK